MKRASVFVLAVLLLAAGVSLGVLLRRPGQCPTDPDTASGTGEPVAVDPGGLPQVFQSDSRGSSIRYPRAGPRLECGRSRLMRRSRHSPNCWPTCRPPANSAGSTQIESGVVCEVGYRL